MFYANNTIYEKNTLDVLCNMMYNKGVIDVAKKIVFVTLNKYLILIFFFYLFFYIYTKKQCM